MTCDATDQHYPIGEKICDLKNFIWVLVLATGNSPNIHAAMTWNKTDRRRKIFDIVRYLRLTDSDCNLLQLSFRHENTVLCKNHSFCSQISIGCFCFNLQVRIYRIGIYFVWCLTETATQHIIAISFSVYAGFESTMCYYLLHPVTVHFPADELGVRSSSHRLDPNARDAFSFGHFLPCSARKIGSMGFQQN